MGMRDPRVLGALFVAVVLGLGVSGAAGAAQVCTPSSPCNAPGATPSLSVPVVVESPDGNLPVASDVLSRPPSVETASILPSAVVVGGVVVLALTLGSIARRRRRSAVAAAPHAVRVRARSARVRSVSVDSRWDVATVERAAAGTKHGS